MKFYFIMLIFAVGLSGCIGIAIARHEAISSTINLGDSIESVLPKINNAMRGLTARAKKRPDQYIQKGGRVEIHYARSQRQPDGLTTDDEFTPYVFNNGILVAIGWQTLGGAKSQGQAVPTTKVVVPPPVIIY